MASGRSRWLRGRRARNRRPRTVCRELKHFGRSRQFLGHSQRKFPPAIDNFWARAEEAHRVIPPLHNREAIGNFVITAAKLNDDRTIRSFYRSVAINRIGAVLVRLNITLTVVDGERPETVDGHASNG